MSAKYPYLDIAISVLNNGTQPVNYSFNSAPTIALPSLSELAHHFVNLSDGYVMWQVGGRRAFTYFQLDEEGKTTVLAITVRMDPDVLMAGRPIVNLLGTIRRTLTDEKQLTHESLMRALSDSGFTEKPLRSDAEVDMPTAAAGLCCRTYLSSTELANIMAYPRQKEYAAYQGVIVIPATVSMLPESSIPMINAPVDKALMVVCPENVTASANCVELSDHLTVTYEMEGFNPESVEFEVGTTNRYVRIHGPALIVNSALHAGIIFTRSVPYSVASASGNALDTYTILINGRTATRGDGCFEVSNTDFVNGKVTIAVSSTNYGSYSREFTPQELSDSLPLEVILEPEARQICLRLDFGGGRIVEDTITLEKSTPEYNNLRAGSFHGFRAHRLMGSTPETYNIDVRQPAQAAVQQPALNFNDRQATTATQRVEDLYAPRPSVAEQKAAEQPKADKPATNRKEQRNEPRRNGPVAPVMEKAPSALWEEKEHKRVAPKFENVAAGETKKAPRVDERPVKEDPKKPEEKIEKKKKDGGDSKMDMRLIIIGVAVIAVALVIWWLMLLFSGTSEPENLQTQQGESIEDVNYTEMSGQNAGNAEGAQTQASQAQATPAAPVAAANDMEKADVEYLNSNREWKLADLKSEKYRALYTAMQQGDIQAIASNPYFSIAGTATNKRAVSVIDYLWKAKGTIQEKRNVGKLQELTKGDKFDLQVLIDDLSRYQPADPNSAPRPGAN